ncbi:hypothetical protein FEM48_Zijuj02G0021200 [Ziziphus jujuba var. spinosa]|uniref:Uncharacterized protein n=1 Tax=Ziziphus jujuba var. spinosa TaxID=714518 RepID=A0A978VT01_ZIZJJ|nr:hypothetical protein FEM48_Zijuj02G0021200 [Ziziphus jujuba var. spinosa]
MAVPENAIVEPGGGGGLTCGANVESSQLMQRVLNQYTIGIGKTEVIIDEDQFRAESKNLSALLADLEVQVEYVGHIKDALMVVQGATYEHSTVPELTQQMWDAKIKMLCCYLQANFMVTTSQPQPYFQEQNEHQRSISG